MDLSLVIPLYNEDESLKELTSWIEKSLQDKNLSYEIIYVDDGSTDDSWNVIRELSDKNGHIKGIKFKRNFGKSAALHEGFEKAQGEVVVTMDADLQDSPDEILEMYDMVRNQGYDLVSGWKKKRFDPITKTIPSKLFNWTTGIVSGIKIHDFNCGLKAYKKDVIKTISMQGEMHRFIPVIAKYSGFGKIGEKIVKHQKRKYGKTKFGIERFINGFLDLIVVTFVSRFGRRPMHLFGLLGTFMFFIGFVITIWLGIQKIISLNSGDDRRISLITDQPLFYIALVVMILGTQLFMTGFLAELITRNSASKNHYVVEDEIGGEEQSNSDT